ncbi:MAG: sensor histidine kinase [Rhizobiaceae bacterium]
MIKRRLYLQIYFTIITSLLLVVVVGGIVFALFAKDSFDDEVFDITAYLAWEALPPATAPIAEQKDALDTMVRQFDMDVTLFDSTKQLIAATGRAAPPPLRLSARKGWQRHRGIKGFRPVWVTRFPDGRWMVVDLRDRRRFHPIFGLIILLSCVALGVGAASYPFVRKLTGRLERLNSGVERLGAGDLSARVEVEGKDEVARLANSFNQASSKIEELVNSNRQLLANASHELRTPLARVRLGVEMMKDKPSEKRQLALENDIAELDQLIDEILLMSRLDTQSTPDLSETVDLLALAAEETSRYENCALEGDLCEIKGNSKLLRRAIRNLIDNGFKHGVPPVDVSIKTTARQVIVSVSDQGTGIAEGQRKDVFEPFYRGAGKQNVEGYGLGLALVRQIAKAHGGQVSIADGAKSKIQLMLPLQA